MSTNKQKTEYKKILIMSKENAEHSIQHEVTGWLISETEHAFYVEYYMGNLAHRRDQAWFGKRSFYYKIIE